jgi:4,5-dihydroxyphthalate decarboxylase
LVHASSQLLLDRKIDAILAYKPIAAFLAGEPKISRLFPEPEVVEAQYFRETGIFPIMHLIGIRKDVVAADPGLARAMFDAFSAAQEIADRDLEIEQALKISLPWLPYELQRTRAIMGSRFWASGFSANRAVVARMIEWSYQDGLLSERLEPEQLFEPSLHCT